MTTSVKETAKSHLEAYMSVKGAKQGDIKGESYRKGLEGKIRLLDFELSAIAPRDLATGIATGKRQHQPFAFETEVGSATPLLMQACVNNEVLTDVKIGVYKHDAKGQESNYLNVHFVNATVSKYDLTGNPPDADYPIARFEITFQKVEVEVEKKMMADDWTAGA
jgi:type VI secretion system secreted protein Hcp